jgi:hypothetical protein
MNLIILPTELARYIYLQLYFPWIVQELKHKYPKNDNFVVHSHSPHSEHGFESVKSSIVEIHTPMYRLYIFPFMALDLYRKGISSHPKDLWQAYIERMVM